MGWLGNLLGKNETGIIIDINGISSDNVHITLRYLSEIFQNDNIVCVTDSADLLDMKCRNMFWGGRMAQFTKKAEVKFDSPVKGVNLIDREYFAQFKSKGSFDWIKKAVIFTDDPDMVKSSLSWTVADKPDPALVGTYWYMVANAYQDNVAGKSTSNELPDSFAKFYIKVQGALNFIGIDLGAPSNDVGQCLQYIITYANYKK
jgi:hypothetical protein